MLVNAAILVNLYENGTIKEVFIRSEKSFWVANVDEYDEPHKGPLFLVDTQQQEEYEKELIKMKAKK